MTILSVRHLTTYRYARPVSFGPHRILFRPRDSNDQRLIRSSLRISPEPEDVRWIHDVFGNDIAVARFSRKGEQLTFECEIELDHTPWEGTEFGIDDTARIWPFTYGEDVLPDLEPVMRRHYADDGEVDAWAKKFRPLDGEKVETGHLLMTLNTAIGESLRYLRRTDPGTQTPQKTLSTMQGTCRDFALLMIETARALGFAARFVTGYLYAPSRDTPERRGGGATHAWVQIFLPGAGWVEFDPTNGIVGNRDLIRVGVARDPSQAKPLSGRFSGARADYLGMTVDVTVTRGDLSDIASEAAE